MVNYILSFFLIDINELCNSLRICGVMLSRRIGRNIAILRKRRGLTQEKLAEKTGLSQNFIARLETGSKNPSIETIEAIANAIGCDIEEIVRKDPDNTNIRTKDLHNRLDKIIEICGKEKTLKILRIIEEILSCFISLL
jgi:transcriptional regulator with XRE-family HTH domain